MTAPYDVVKLLEWDSAFFGYPIARLDSVLRTRPALSSALEWCSQHKVRCLYYLVEAYEVEAVRIAEGLGFRFADIRMTYVHTLGERLVVQHVHGLEARAGVLEDLAAFIPVVRTSYIYSRFSKDSGFDPSRVADMYQVWLEKCFVGQADYVAVIAGTDDAPLGFVTCHLDSDKAGHIELVGVTEAARGSGVGPLAVGAALDWFASKWLDSVTVVTQGANIPARRLYENAGFRGVQTQVWLHYWFDVKGS